MVSEGAATSSVQVALRIKPITEEDLEKLPSRFQRQVITTPSNAHNQVIVEGEKRQIFHFDHVFPPETTQQQVYERAVESSVDRFLEGYNVTILAYGQTSSGKTHTMGTADNASIPYESKGIIPRAMATLFNIINNNSVYLNRKFSIKVSFIEIYNEDLIDLLADGEGGPQVTIREDSKGNIYWSGLQEVQVNNVGEVIANLSRGSLNRQVGATDMNSKSSRSHAIFSLTMSQQKLVSQNGYNGHSKSPSPGSRPTTPSSKLVGSRSNSRANSRLDHEDGDHWVTISSKFHFVDLAGSERLKRTAASGDRAKEGISINSGLLALGNVISALGDPTKAKHTTHIPYRDSKLTRLLQDSLGGNAQTLMIACVSPAEFNLNETVNTLKYANRARNIKNIASINQEETGWNDVVHLQSLVIKLRGEVSHLKVALANTSSSNGTSSPGRLTPVGGRETPSRIKSPTAGYHSAIPTTIGGRKTPTPTGRVTPTSSGIPQGRVTPTSGIPGRSTPTKSGIQGRVTPTGIPSGRNNLARRPTSPLTTFSHGNNSTHNEALEEQLSQLQQSYAELSQKYAKTSAELAMHQDNHESNKAVNGNFMELTEPVIEEYEKSISSLESKLAITLAALTHSESLLKEQEEKFDTLEKHQAQTKSLNANLQKYIKELESKLEKREFDAKFAVVRDEHPEKFVSEAVKVLEERLKEREEAYKELEEKYKQINVDQDKQELLDIINNRDKRISFLDTRLNQLGDEVEKLREIETQQKSTADTNDSNNTSSSDNEQDLLTIKSLEEKLRQTETELNETRSKYEQSLLEIQELQSQYDSNSEFTLTPITPMTPETPMTLNNAYNTNVPSKAGVHRKAKSLSEGRELAHAAIIEKLQFELKLFESFHKDKQKSLEAVKRELDLLEVDYQETSRLVDELQEELKKHDNKIISNEPDNNTLLLQGEIEQLKEKQNQLLQNIAEHEIENNKKSEEIVRLESNVAKLSSLELEIKNKEDLIKQELENKDLLQKNLKDKETELAILTKQLMDLRKQDEDMQKRMKELQVQLDNSESIKETNKSLEDDLNNIKKELMIVKERENQALEQLQELDAEESKLQKELEHLRIVEITQRERIVVLEAQLSDQGAQIDSELINIKSELAISKESEITNKQTIANLESKLSKSESLISNLQSEIDVLNSKEKELSDTKSEMESLLLELENQVTTAEKERDQYSEKANESSKVLEEQESKRKEEIETLELTIMNLKNELNDTKTISQTYHDKMKSSEERLSDLEAQLGKEKASNGQHVQKINDLNSTLNESNTEHKELIFAKDAQIKELESTIEKINEKLADAELSKTSESEHVKSLRNKIAEIETKLEQSPSLSDLESAQQYTAKQIVIVKELERKINEINEINSSEVAKLNESIETLTKELKEAESADDAQKSLINELESELKEKEDKMAELNEMLNNVNGQLNEKNERLVSEENHEQVQKLQKDLDSMTKELADISTKHKDAEVLSEEYKTQISKLEAALEGARKLSNDEQKTDETLEISESETKISTKDIIAKDNLIKSLQEKIVELERRTLDNQSEQTSESDNSNLTKHEVEIKELNQKISEVEEISEEKAKSIVSLEEIIKDHKVEIEESRQKLDKLQVENEDYKSRLEAMTEQYHTLKGIEESNAKLKKVHKETKRPRFMCF